MAIKRQHLRYLGFNFLLPTKGGIIGIGIEIGIIRINCSGIGIGIGITNRGIGIGSGINQKCIDSTSLLKTRLNDNK